MVSHSCLLVELGPICNSMATSLCFKSCEDHSFILKSYNGEVYERQLQVWALWSEMADAKADLSVS